MSTVCKFRSIPKRYWVTILSFFGVCCMYLLRTNLSIALVEMTSDIKVITGNHTNIRKAAFSLSSREIGFLLSLFSYGYVSTPIGGYLATIHGGATLFGFGIVGNALLVLFTPFLMRYQMWIYSLSRIIQGVFQGFAVSGYVQVFVQWAPPDERSRMMINAHVGCFFATIINYPLSGFIAKSFGWEAIFYASGGVSLLWSLIWFVFVSDDPQKDKFITEEEREFLKEKIIVPIEKVDYPWREIFTSKPVWAYMNDCFSASWSYSFLVYCLPIYVKDLYDVNIESIGLISSIPNLFSIISEVIAATVADHLRSRKILSIPNVHRLYITFGQAAAIILLVTSGLCDSFFGSIACFSAIRFCFCFAETSYEVLPIDMASQYASLISALGTMSFSFGCLASPSVMGFIVSNHSATEWSHFFIFLCVFNIWGSVIFWTFGSGDLQQWANH